MPAGRGLPWCPSPGKVRGVSKPKKPARRPATPRRSAPKSAADKQPRGAPAPVGDKAPSSTAPPEDKTPASPTAPVGDKPPPDAPSESKAPEETPRFRVGRPSNPYLVLHPPPRLGRRR